MFKDFLVPFFLIPKLFFLLVFQQRRLASHMLLDSVRWKQIFPESETVSAFSTFVLTVFFIYAHENKIMDFSNWFFVESILDIDDYNNQFLVIAFFNALICILIPAFIWICVSLKKWSRDWIRVAVRSGSIILLSISVSLILARFSYFEIKGDAPVSFENWPGWLGAFGSIFILYILASAVFVFCSSLFTSFSLSDPPNMSE